MDKRTRNQFGMADTKISQKYSGFWQEDESPNRVARLRFWQLADGLNQSPYMVTSPVPYFKGTMVQGRLCGMSLDGMLPVLEDLHIHAHEHGLFLRIYTATVDGTGLMPLPMNEEELQQKTILNLNQRMTIFLRDQVRKTLCLPSNYDVSDMIAQKPSLLNVLWEDPLFSHVKLMGWTGSFNFGRSLHQRVTFYALRDKSCLIDVVCHQNPSLKMSEMLIA